MDEGEVRRGRGSQTTPPGSEARAQTAQEVVAHGAGFNAAHSALYHKHREGFLSACHRWSMFAVILSGSATVATLVESESVAAKLFALLPAAIGALDIAMAFSQRARDHALLSQRFSNVAAKLAERVLESSQADAVMYRLWGEEAPTFNAVNTLCYNQLLESLGDTVTSRRHVHFWKRRLRHLIRFDAAEFPPIPLTPSTPSEAT